MQNFYHVALRNLWVQVGKSSASWGLFSVCNFFSFSHDNWESAAVIFQTKKFSTRSLLDDIISDGWLCAESCRQKLSPLNTYRLLPKRVTNRAKRVFSNCVLWNFEGHVIWIFLKSFGMLSGMVIWTVLNELWDRR